MLKTSTTYYYYYGTTLPTESNINTIGTSVNAKPTTWTADNPKSIAATNNTGSSAPLYYCFPTNWNVIVLDSDKVSEVLLADVSTFTYNSVNYTVKKTGRNISSGVTKDLYAKLKTSTTYYYYVGTTKPTSLSQASTVTSYPAESTYTNNSGAKSHIFVLTNKFLKKFEE